MGRVALAGMYGFPMVARWSTQVARLTQLYAVLRKACCLARAVLCCGHSAVFTETTYSYYNKKQKFCYKGEGGGMKP